MKRAAPSRNRAKSARTLPTATSATVRQRNAYSFFVDEERDGAERIGAEGCDASRLQPLQHLRLGVAESIVPAGGDHGESRPHGREQFRGGGGCAAMMSNL